MKKIKYIVLIVITLLLDLISKTIIMNNFKVGESKVIIKNFFKLTYTHNNGAAFGLFGGKTLFIVLVSLFILSYLVYEVFRNKKDKSITSLAASLMIGGLLGNLFDRIVYGYVRDFLDFKIFGYDFAVFNVGDTLIVVGAVMLLIGVIWEERHEDSNK